MSFLLFPSAVYTDKVQSIPSLACHPTESTMFTSVPDPSVLAHLHEQARREARRLRRLAVDAFWMGVYAAWHRGLVACTVPSG
jgi:hypothetical protein